MRFGKLKGSKNTLKWCCNAVKVQALPLIVISLLTCVLACAGSVIAMIVGRLVDSATNGRADMFVGFAVLLALVYVLDIALSAIIKYTTARCKALIDVSMRRNFFAMLMKKDYSHLSGYHSGELMNRITSDVSTVSDAAANLLPNFAGFITRFIFAFVLILYIQPWLALFYIVCGVAVFGASVLFRKRTKKLHKLAQKAEDENRSFWQEALYNLLTVKVFAANDKMNKQSDKLLDNTYKARMNSSRFSVLASSGYSLLLTLGYVFAFVWCGVCLLLGIMSVGTLTTVVQLISQIQSPFTGLSSIFTQYFIAIASAERLMEIERLPDEKQVEYLNSADTYSEMQSIEVKGLSFAYDRYQIFNDADFAVKKGEFVGIVGNSGIGKSTLFKLILGVYTPDSGEIYIKTDSVKIDCDASVRQLFAYVPQGNMMFTGSLKDNITLLDESVDDDVLNSAIKASCLDEFVDSLPNGLDTPIGEKGLGLSEGQAQRIAIARALVSGAPILLLDEATSALDGETEACVLNNLREMENKTCIIVTHRLKALDICDRTVNVEQGKIRQVSE